MPALAQDEPVEYDFNQHSFFSAPVDMGTNGQKAFYKVCNESGSSSSFRWYGPGFGVDSLAGLADEQCLFRSDAHDGTLKYEPRSKVTFTGGASDDDVPTWLSANPPGWIRSQIMTRLTGPDGVAPLSAITVNSQRYEDGSGEVFIGGEGHFNDMMIVLPRADADAERLSASMHTEFSRGSAAFGETSARPELATSPLITEDELAGAPTLLDLRGDGGVQGRMFFKEFDLLGGEIWVFVIGRDASDADVVAIRQDVLLPTGPR